MPQPAACRRLVLPLLVGLAACSRPHPDVVLVVVDTWRFDSLSMNGAPWPTTPGLDAWARDARVYTRGYASSSWTLASTGSLLTGRHARNHGLVDPAKRLNPEAETLAEHLSSRGYTTHAVVANPLVASAPDLLQGFDQTEGKLEDHVFTGHQVTEAALAALDKGRPDFLYVHYMDPHYPYLNHPELDWAPAAGVGRLKGGEDINTLRGMELSPEERGFVVACYLEEVRATDTALSKLLAGLDENTLVMVTSDHGEELLERGWLGHVRTLHEELVHVPLLVKGPGIAPGPVTTPTLNGGLYALVSAQLRTWLPREVQIPSVTRESAPEAGVLVEVDYNPQSLKYSAKEAHAQAWITAEQKLIHEPLTGVTTLYDLRQDPGERSGSPGADSALRQQLETALQTAAEGALERAWKTPDEEARELLEALGYLE